MNATNSDLSWLMDGEETVLLRMIMPWVTDIDEVAQVHVNTLYNADAAGRYIIANSAYDIQQAVDKMFSTFGDEDWIRNVPRGAPGKKEIERHFVLDNRWSREDLGVVYRDWTECSGPFAGSMGRIGSGGGPMERKCSELREVKSTGRLPGQVRRQELRDKM
ncbi:hypothetical protein BDV12DRAFT_200905 [Aspergillus spectabilis]